MKYLNNKQDSLRQITKEKCLLKILKNATWKLVSARTLPKIIF